MNQATPAGPARTIRNYLSLIKFSHTIFALPFAIVGFLLATLELGSWSWRTLGLVVLCMIFARSAAMAFNRYLDRHIDADNPRTAVREIPAGILSPRSVLIFVAINCALFVLCAWLLNPLTFALSPLALLVILGYSYTKRFTALCHFVLGLGLSLAPIGAYLATGAGWDVLPLLYSGVVLLWVAGFDIIYALQDEAFDRDRRLSSIPSALGRHGALRLSNFIHLVCAGLLLFAVYLQGLRYEAFAWIHWLAAGVFLILLLYQHRLVKPDDLSRVNLAFFTTNGVASLVFGTLVALDVWV